MLIRQYFVFLSYFVKYCFQAKTRQKLILLVMIGLALCSFSLIVLQGVMSGLQANMITSYKKVQGEFSLIIPLNSENQSEIGSLEQDLKKEHIFYVKALALELLMKHGQYMAPTLIYGMEDFSDNNENNAHSANNDNNDNIKVAKNSMPRFLQDLNREGIVLGADLAAKLKAGPDSSLLLYSPAHLSNLLGDVPRFVAERVSDIALSSIEDIDLFYSWTRASLLHNLTRSNQYNRMVFFDSDAMSWVKNLINKKYPQVKMQTWDELNADLVWAFKLESIVIIGLFTMMSVLVSLTILSAYSLFLTKVQLEMFVFWLMGRSQRQIKNWMLIFSQSLALIAILMGVLLGLALLFYLKNYAPVIMPDVFVERSLPVSFQLRHFVYAILLPFMIASVFTFFSIKEFFGAQGSMTQLMRRLNA